MRRFADTYLFSGAFAPVLSLDSLIGNEHADGFNGFDIPDEESLPPDEQIAQAEGFAAVDAFISALPERDQMIIRRLFWLGHTQTQIAADLGVSKMAISKALARICRIGRSQLAPHQHLALIN